MHLPLNRIFLYDANIVVLITLLRSETSIVHAMIILTGSIAKHAMCSGVLPFYKAEKKVCT